MTGFAWIFPVLAAAGLAFGIWQRCLLRRTLRRLNAMLDRAIAGGFSEELFDESELSALETRMSRFLRGSSLALKKARGEQEAVKTLISDISHQTRTPIANLMLYASLLSEGDLTGRQKEQAAALLAQSEKLSFLIQALKGKRGKADPLLRGRLPCLRRRVLQKRFHRVDSRRRGHDARFQPGRLYQGDTAFDPRWTAEALFNVVDNAVKYTPSGGQVTISARSFDFFCRVDVEDTGPGIPEEEQGKIFNRFYREKASGGTEGLGLGLYLAREILTRQGGHIRVVSSPGKGCVFSLYLPREIFQHR